MTRSSWRRPLATALALAAALAAGAPQDAPPADDPGAAAVATALASARAEVEQMAQSGPALDLPLFPNRATPPLLEDDAASVYALLDAPPLALAVHDASGRVFAAVDERGRPEQHPKLVELVDGTPRAFPNQALQGEMEAIAAIHMDQVRGTLLVLDCHPFGATQPRLLLIRLADGEVVKRFEFDEAIAPQATLAAMALDSKAPRFLYIADSSVVRNTPGIVVLDLHIWLAWRVLEGHDSVRGQTVLPMLNQHEPVEYPWTVGVSTLALEGDRLLFASLFGDRVFSVPVARVNQRPAAGTSADVASAVEAVGVKTAAGGLLALGKALYLTDVEHSAVTLVELAQHGAVTTLVHNEALLRWPTAIAAWRGSLLVASTAHHLTASARGGGGPFHVVRIALAGSGAHDEL